MFFFSSAHIFLCNDCGIADILANNAFIATIVMAYNLHYPLVLSPDEVWLTIAQGLATHIRQNSEEMRSKFVDHQDKKNLEVFGDYYGIRRGDPNNDWGRMKSKHNYNLNCTF